jgi:hypothetical protein
MSTAHKKRRVSRKVARGTSDIPEPDGVDIKTKISLIEEQKM